MLKRLLSALYAALLAASFTSCSAGSETTGRSDIDESGEVSTAVTDTAPESAADTAEERIITVAVTRNSYSFLEDHIAEFNSENNGYRIECRSYDEFYDDSYDNDGGSTFESFAKIDNQIVLDLIKGENIDIIPDMSFTDQGRFNELVKKGAFTDLYPFLDSDEEISRETLNDHILEVNATNGELKTIPLFYKIDTLYGETQYVGEKRNWTFDELAGHWGRMPENSAFCGKKHKIQCIDRRIQTESGFFC